MMVFAESGATMISNCLAFQLNVITTTIFYFLKHLVFGDLHLMEMRTCSECSMYRVRDWTLTPMFCRGSELVRRNIHPKSRSGQHV